MSEATIAGDRTVETALDVSELHASSTGATSATLSTRVAAAWAAIELRLMRLSDWFNPILVKETRQALRSWQFMLTFVLLLVACWVVTIGGVALIGPSVFYAAGGGEMLRAYYAILSLPLVVVVPFAAFRSLAAEREDNTYDLLSITTLRPRQIIGGKLGSSVLQMIVFFSAITPCLAFTYLLRGIDAPTIALLLVYAFFTSLGLSMIGLLLATLSRQRYSQLVLSVGFIAVLLYAFYIMQLAVAELVRSSYLFLTSEEFWIVHLLAATFYATSFALAYFAAAGMITFSTENRSTPLRIVMLSQQATLVGWIAYGWIESSLQTEMIFALAILAGSYWYGMGTMLDGERSGMSRRVMRSLPQSTVGRLFCTWLNPGPASGYMFAVANLSTILLLCFLGIAISEFSPTPAGRWPSVAGLTYFLIIGWSYLVAYLGLGCLVVALLRRFAIVTMFASVLLHLLLLLAGSGIPTSIQLMSLELQNELYSYMQITNPFWTLWYVVYDDSAPEITMLLIAIPATAICVLLLNLPSMVRELKQVRTALPVRVAEDEAELHPPPETLPQNPWDDY